MTGAVPGDSPVLVTGAGGFVGGHVARELATAGYRVIGLTRRPPQVEPGDPAIDWCIGDLRDSSVRREALRGVRGVIHTAGWVSLGADRSGDATAVNVDATRSLLNDAAAAGVEKFVFTSTLHTLAAGTADLPADEEAAWNLRTVDGPYSRTKREAEQIVMDGSGGMAGVVICPGMVLGPRDPKPTSTRVVLMMARNRLAFLPGGGIPIVDASVIALAHKRALEWGDPGRRFAVVGPYLSYREMARLVARLTGNPRFVIPCPDFLERPAVASARLAERLMRVGGDFSAPGVAGGFLRLFVSGRRADEAFGLIHPPAIRSIYATLEYTKASGRMPRLYLCDRETVGL